METGVSGVHARDSINASAAESPESLDDIREVPLSITKPKV
jgi:hypothetical protein